MDLERQISALLYLTSRITLVKKKSELITMSISPMQVKMTMLILNMSSDLTIPLPFIHIQRIIRESS